MQKRECLIPVEKRILLHLLNHRGPDQKFGIPTELAYNGIAEAINTKPSYVYRRLDKLSSQGYIEEYMGRISKGRKKQKYYKLTKKGREFVKKFKKEVSNLQIYVKEIDGNHNTLVFKEIILFLTKDKIFSNISDQDLYNNILSDHTLDVTQLVDIKKAHYVDYSSEAPTMTHFFGRKKEMVLLDKWMEEKKSHNLIFIRGMAGIGKTTLAAKLIDGYRQSKHLFWHNFHDLDTLRGFLNKMAEFLSKLGQDHLEFHLRSRSDIDYFEVSKILEKSIGVIEAVIIFDDFHKSNEQIRKFFVYFLRMLSTISNTKILILSRELVPFYDRRDVLSKEIVGELGLEGLDFNSSKKLLQEKNIDKSHFKTIYELTGGNPLFLEVIDSRDQLERFMYDELFLKLGEEEINILVIISIFRFPISKQSLNAYDNFNFNKLYTLTQKSIVKKDATDRYFIHDVIKQFFYSRLSPKQRRELHIKAASWYKNQDTPLELIEAIYHFQEGEEHQLASSSTIDLSEIILDSGHAAEFLSIIERFEKKNLDTTSWAQILIIKGRACNMLGEWKKALLYFTQSADLASISGNDKLEVNAIWESGHILEEQNQFDKAMDSFKKCLDISRESGYHQGIGEAFRGIGRVHWRKSEHTKAISNYKKCLEISKKLDSNELTASVYIDLGNIYDEKYEIEKAIECYNKSLDILKDLKNISETARAYMNLAVTYRHLEELNKSIDYYKKSIELVQNLQNIRWIGYGDAGISYCFAKINKFREAYKYAKKAENIAKKIDNENIMLDVYKTHGLIAKQKGKYDETINYFKRSVKTAERQNALYYLSDTHLELGRIYKEIGDEKKAKKHFNIAKKLYSKLGLEKNKIVKDKLP